MATTLRPDIWRQYKILMIQEQAYKFTLNEMFLLFWQQITEIFFLVGWQTSCLEMTKLYWIAVTTFFSYTINFGDKKTHRHKYLALIKYIAIDQLVLAKMSNQFELGVNISRRNCRYCPNTTLACSVHTSCTDVCNSYLTSFNFVQTLPTWWALRQNFSTKILCPISQHCRQVRF